MYRIGDFSKLAGLSIKTLYLTEIQLPLNGKEMGI